MAVNLAQAPASCPQASQDAPALKQIFSTIHASSCPRLFNFHMHTVCSDGKLKPIELIQQALNIGLRGLAITDHHSVTGYQIAQQWLDEQQDLSQQELNSQASNCTDPQLQSTTQLPQLWTGIEITSYLLGIEVHILGYAFDPGHAALQPYLQGKRPHGSDSLAANVISSIQQAGGLAVLAHPERYRRSGAELIPEAARLGIDGVEAYYAYTNPNPWKPSTKQTKRVLQLSQKYSLLNTCGTDTHGLNLLQRL